jgi:hypothetical protein
MTPGRSLPRGGSPVMISLHLCMVSASNAPSWNLNHPPRRRPGAPVVPHWMVSPPPARSLITATASVSEPPCSQSSSHGSDPPFASTFEVSFEWASSSHVHADFIGCYHGRIHMYVIPSRVTARPASGHIARLLSLPHIHTSVHLHTRGMG